MDVEKLEQIGQLGNNLNKESSKQNKSKIINNSKDKIDHNAKESKNRDKKSSDKKVSYSSVRITTNTSLKLHALLKASDCKNRDELINDLIYLAKPKFLKTNAEQKKYEKAYDLYKIQRKQDKELDKQ